MVVEIMGSELDGLLHGLSMGSEYGVCLLEGDGVLDEVLFLTEGVSGDV